jgi:hypothetical protein
MLLYLWLILTLFFDWPVGLKLAGLAVYLAATFYAEAAIPGDVLWGGALYLPTLFLMLVISTVLYWRRLHGARRVPRRDSRFSALVHRANFRCQSVLGIPDRHAFPVASAERRASLYSH